MTSPAGATVSGNVLDFDARTPLADVQVMAIYTSESGIGHSETVCTQVEEMATGADGRYQFPAGRYRAPIVKTFKRGYIGVPNPRYVDQRSVVVDGRDEPRFFAVEVDRSTRPPRIVREELYPTRAQAEAAARVNETYLKPFTGTREQRLKELWPYATGALCLEAGSDRKKQVPYLSAIYAEIRDLAITKDELKTLEAVQFFVESAKTAN